MKLPILLSILVFIIISIFLNIFYLKLPIMQFIGIMLFALIIIGIIVNFSKKARNKRKGIEGEPDAFIFPDGAAKKMKTMSLDIQYEASVISSSLLMLGIILFLIYFIFFTTSSWIMKGLIIFNSLCGLGLMGGMVVTYFQQLVSYRESTKFLREAAANQPQPQQEGLNEQEDYYAQ